MSQGILLLPSSSDLPHFKEGQNPDNWIKRFERIADSYKWNEHDKIRNLRVFVPDVIADEIDTIVSNNAGITWSQLKQEFVTKHALTDTERQSYSFALTTEMMSPFESVMTYTDRYIKIARTAGRNLNDPDVITNYVRGLRADIKQAMYMQDKTYPTLQQAITAARNYEMKVKGGLVTPSRIPANVTTKDDLQKCYKKLDRRLKYITSDSNNNNNLTDSDTSDDFDEETDMSDLDIKATKRSKSKKKAKQKARQQKYNNNNNVNKNNMPYDPRMYGMRNDNDYNQIINPYAQHYPQQAPLVHNNPVPMIPNIPVLAGDMSQNPNPALQQISDAIATLSRNQQEMMNQRRNSFNYSSNRGGMSNNWRGGGNRGFGRGNYSNYGNYNNNNTYDNNRSNYDRNNYNNPNTNSNYCTHCRRPGHTIDYCRDWRREAQEKLATKGITVEPKSNNNNRN